MDVNGKCVFLTGGASGIGKAIVEDLATKGAKVFFCDLDKQAGGALETELRKRHGNQNFTFAECNVSKSDQLQDVFRRAISILGRIDVCVNNAGIIDEHNWEKMISINMTAYIRVSKLSLEHMRRDKGGHGGVIIQVASIAGLIPVHQHPVYCACKHAIIGFTESWATHPQAKSFGVRWGCLCPGVTDTPLLNSLKDNAEVEDLDGFLQSVQQAKVGVEVVVKAFLGLLCDETSQGALQVVFSEGTYRRRALVDNDGASNLWLLDSSTAVEDKVLHHD